MLISLSPGWNTLVAGRILAGAGGVVLNIVMTKMLVDWFAGREISTALAIFVNSWPVGIALALLVLPQVSLLGGLAAAWWVTTGIIGASLILFAALYHPPEGVAAGATHVKATKLPFYTLALASLIWALYNTALAMVFSFGPALFAQKGWSLADAGGMTSAFMVVFSLALPFGGIIADRRNARDAVIFVSLLGFVVLIPLALYGPGFALMPAFLMAAVFFALAAGPIMTHPSVVLSAEARAFGMGVFFSIYYAVMMIGPRLAGGFADRAGDVSVAFLIGMAMSLICVLALVLFRRAVAAMGTPST
jgi:MFS family permease